MHKDWVETLHGWQTARLLLGRFLVFCTPSYRGHCAGCQGGRSAIRLHILALVCKSATPLELW